MLLAMTQKRLNVLADLSAVVGVLGRRFHHIKALSKRKAIVQWASELHLGGFSKPGFPGAPLRKLYRLNPSSRREFTDMY